jgi:two-component system cell cycle sensor histidine kinase/response regulator CckA
MRGPKKLGKKFATSQKIEIDLLMPQSKKEYLDQLAVFEQNLDVEGDANVLADVQRLAGVGALTAGIAQELANLLSIVSTASISLRYELQQSDPPEDVVHHYLNLIERNAFRADQIVAMLQAYGASDTKKMALTDIDTILRDMMMLVERHFREESNILVKVMASNEPQFLICDHNRIVQLLVNLLLNARESMPGTGGSIEVKVEAAHNGQSGIWGDTIALPLEGTRCIAISIVSGEERANGQGEITHPVISTKPNGSNNLGLSVANEIVRQHKGNIQFSNSRDPGKGVSVIVVLPVRPPV